MKSAEDESGTAKQGELIQPAAICGFKDAWFKGVTATADAYPVMTESGVRTVYATTFKNRRPEVPIKSVEFFLPKSNEGKDMEVYGGVVWFGVLA